MTGRQLQVGDVVNVGGGTTPWKVEEIREHFVWARSQRSGIRRSHSPQHLYWHGTRERVLPTGTQTMRTPEADQPGYFQKSNGAVFIDGKCIRGSDNYAAAITCWQPPREENSPSMVGFSVVHDPVGDEYLKLIAAGPGGVAYLTRSDAMRMAQALLGMVPHMREAGGAAD